MQPLPRPRLTALQRRGAVSAAPRQDVPSVLAGFLPLLLLCGTKAQRVGAPDPSTPSLAITGQGVGCGQSQGAGVRSPEWRKGTLHISLNPHKDPGGGRQLLPILQMGKLRLGGEGACAKPQTRQAMKRTTSPGLTPEPSPSSLPRLLCWSPSTPLYTPPTMSANKTHLPWIPAKTQKRL